MRCDRPPKGWVCWKQRDHSGPCPAYPLRGWARFACLKMGWHPARFRTSVGFDGVSAEAKCERCGFVGMVDSQGNLF